MLKIKCDKCGKELNKPGALMFSAPDPNDSVYKFHFCVKCYDLIYAFLYLED